MHNNNDELISSTDFNGDETKYSYDTFGYLTGVEYARGSKTEYIYDENEVLTDVKFTDGESIQNTHYDYNGLDGLKKSNKCRRNIR